MGPDKTVFYTQTNTLKMEETRPDRPRQLRISHLLDYISSVSRFLSAVGVNNMVTAAWQHLSIHLSVS